MTKLPSLPFQSLLTLSLLSPLSSLLSPHLLIKFPPFISFILSFSLSFSLSPPFSLYQFQDLRKSNHFIRLKMKLLRTKTVEGFLILHVWFLCFFNFVGGFCLIFCMHCFYRVLFVLFWWNQRIGLRKIGKM